MYINICKSTETYLNQWTKTNVIIKTNGKSIETRFPWLGPANYSFVYHFDTG